MIPTSTRGAGRPEALSALRRSPTYFRARLTARSVAPAITDATLAIASYQFISIRKGATAVVSPSVEQLLGRPSRTIREFGRDYADRFGR